MARKLDDDEDDDVGVDSASGEASTDDADEPMQVTQVNGTTHGNGVEESGIDL
jgi:hypothetical protein